MVRAAFNPDTALSSKSRTKCAMQQAEEHLELETLLIEGNAAIQLMLHYPEQLSP